MGTGRAKPFAKHTVHTVVYSGRAGTSSLATPPLLMASDEAPAIWGMCVLLCISLICNRCVVCDSLRSLLLYLSHQSLMQSVPSCYNAVSACRQLCRTWLSTDSILNTSLLCEVMMQLRYSFTVSIFSFTCCSLTCKVHIQSDTHMVAS